MKPFFVTGMPRSRTAWLSVFLSSDGMLCEHDLLSRVQSLDCFTTLMCAQGIAGDSDSGLLSAVVDVGERFMESPWVLVRRDPQEAWESLRAFCASGPWRVLPLCDEARDVLFRMYEDAARLLTDNPRCLVVDFADLDSMDALRSIWDWCRPDTGFDSARAQALCRMRVNVVQGPIAHAGHNVERIKAWVQ